MKLKIIITIGLIFSLASSSQAQQYYMFLGTNDGVVKGNSLTEGYKGADGWSQILNFDHNVTSEVNVGGGAVPTSFPAQSGVIAITKLYFPSVSNHISNTLHTGKTYKKVHIVGLKNDPNGGGLVKFVEYDFRNVMVGNFNMQIANTGNYSDLIDTISMRAGALFVTHYTFNPVNGNSTPTSTGWNFSQNIVWDGTGNPVF